MAVNNKMRAIDGSSFTTAFGDVFERYVHGALDFAAIPFTPERELRRRLPGRKVVDFLVVHEGTAIVIETKAVEPGVWAQAQPDDATRLKRFSAIVKATAQICVMAEALDVGLVRDIPRFGPVDVFGLVVTFKEHYLGTGEAAWRDFLGLGVQDELGSAPASFRPANLLFATIHDFDLLIEIVHDDPAKLVRIIRESAARNAEPMRQKFTFRQHLEHEVVPEAGRHRIQGTAERYAAAQLARFGKPRG